MPFNTAESFLEENRDANKQCESHLHCTNCPDMLPFYLYLMVTCSLLWILPSLLLYPSSPACLGLPLTPFRRTHTCSSISSFPVLLSQGSTPILLLYLPRAYFASGLSLSHLCYYGSSLPFPSGLCIFHMSVSMLTSCFFPGLICLLFPL